MKSSLRLCITLFMAIGIFACTPSSKSEAAASGGDKAVVAVVNGVSVTNKELEDFSKGQIYQMKRRVLDGLVDKQLVDAKAKATGKSTEDFLKEEVFNKIPAPSDAELQATYDNAKAAGQQLPPFDDIKQNISQFLNQQKVQGAEKAFYDKLRAEAKVEIKLPAYRTTVSTKGPSKGPKDAKVTIVEYSDFQCPACSQGEKLVEEVLKAYPTQVRVVYRDFPLNIHPHAPKAAEAAHCADDQGKYWEMHAKLFENQRALEVASLKEYAKTLTLDQAKFDNCLDSGAKKGLVDDGMKEGMGLDLRGTPSFFVNGIPLMLEGASPMDSFKKLIDEELAMKK